MNLVEFSRGLIRFGLNPPGSAMVDDSRGWLQSDFPPLLLGKFSRGEDMAAVLGFVLSGYQNGDDGLRDWLCSSVIPSLQMKARRQLDDAAYLKFKNLVLATFSTELRELWDHWEASPSW